LSAIYSLPNVEKGPGLQILFMNNSLSRSVIWFLSIYIALITQEYQLVTVYWLIYHSLGIFTEIFV